MSAPLLLARDDPRYPVRLRCVPEAPDRLHVAGDLDLLGRRTVAIVGSRHPSPYGIRVAYDAARELADSGLVVVSGMALGLDARAHEGALDAGGGTIGVLGCGLDVVYPLRHRTLYADVRQRGLLVTEYPPGTRPLKRHFPERNRIIAGLAEALVVVEGRIKGGTSNTVEWMNKLGRPVFAVPGRLEDWQAQGPNHLIHQGSRVYLSPDDVLRELKLPARPAPSAELGLMLERGEEERAAMGAAEAAVYDVISQAPLHVDALAEKSALAPGVLLAALSALEIKGLVTQLPGKRFALAS